MAWELEHITALGSPRVFIGEGTRFGGGELSSAAPGSSPHCQRAAAELLRDETVLLYSRTEDTKSRRFRKNLDRAVRYAVLGRGRTPSWPSPSMVERFGGVIGSLLFYGVAVLLALLLGRALLFIV